MKKLLLLILSVFIIDLSAQVEPGIKGVRPTVSSKSIVSGTTRAVIVGVSNYQSEGIPDLKYAHKDAAAFKAYLQSSAGGNIAEEQIQLLVDEEATTAKMVAALDWLISESKKGDKAIIYFSGHGDVETKTAMQMGFLLTHDSPANVYMAGAYPIFYLQSIVATMSAKDIQVVLITDACRAGKLAGNANGGVQATTSALSQQFANEVKILSCQPDEFSLEGEQWGGGRGCFSYHLIEGLIGLADNNADASINLLEIGRYLEDNVTAEAAPQSQIPFTMGKKNTALFQVNSEALASLKEEKLYDGPQMASIDTKGIQQNAYADLEAGEQNLIHSFLEKINQKQLLRPANDCAEYYYKKIIQNPDLAQYHQQLKRNYAVVLQEEAQQYINLMLQGDPQLIDDYVYNRQKKFDRFPNYLERATELLGESHYMYKNLKQKEFFFRGVLIKDQIQREKQKNKDVVMATNKALAFYQKALSWDSTAAYVHLALAKTYQEKSLYKKSVTHINRAIDLAPNWALAIATKGFIYAQQKERSRAIHYYKKAIETDKRQLYIIQWLVNEYRVIGDVEAMKYWNEQQIALIENKLKDKATPTANYYEGLLAIAYSEIGEYKKAAELFTAIFNSMDRKDAVLLHAQALNYFWMKEYKKAREAIKESILLVPNANAYTLLGLIYKDQKKWGKARKNIDKAIELNPQFAYAHYVKGKYYVARKKTKKAEAAYLQAYASDPINPKYSKQVLDWYKKYAKEERAVDLALQKIEEIRPNAAIYKGFALIYRELGQKGNARDCLKKALSFRKAEIIP